MDDAQILRRLAELPGKAGLYYKNLDNGETLGLRQEELFLAASVIKLPVCAAVLKLCQEGRGSLEETLLCPEEEKLPPCGALCFFPGPIRADIRTLCALMISLSDNTAANMLLRRFGLEELNRQFRALCLEKTHLERLLFDDEAAAKGLENRICLRELGELLERMFQRGLVSPQADETLEALLLQQQINHKIPGYFPAPVPVAHKTGEDEGITNDVGLVFTPRPFLLCFAYNGPDVPAAERALREISLSLYLRSQS